MRVASQEVDQAGVRVFQDEVPSTRAGDELRRPLDQRAARRQLAQPIFEVRRGMALGMGDDRVYATRFPPADQRKKVIGERSRSRLEQNPAATRPLADLAPAA